MILFIDYYDMKREDLTFKLLNIQIPTGSGKRVNRIITVDSKRSIIQIRNKDTLCLARAIVVGLAVHNREKLQDVFRGNIAEDEMREIDRRRQVKSQINNGVLSDNEKTYLVQGVKIQEVLAKALHRICKVLVKKSGNDFEDVKRFEERLNIEIKIYDLESRQIYKGRESPVKVYILKSENHYDVIGNITGFTCVNHDRNKSEYSKCKACKNKTKCNTEEPHVSCIKCCKYFYGISCLGNHTANKKCIEYSYMCKKCHRLYKTTDLKLEGHRCDEIKCGNCKEFVNLDHQCYMLKKDIKPHSEKYIFFDFEPKLDPKTNKHSKLLHSPS